MHRLRSVERLNASLKSFTCLVEEAVPGLLDGRFGFLTVSAETVVISCRLSTFPMFEPVPLSVDWRAKGCDANHVCRGDAVDKSCEAETASTLCVDRIASALWNPLHLSFDSFTWRHGTGEPSPPTSRSCPARNARFKVVVSWLERSAVATGRAIGAACLDKTPLRGARPWFVCDACSGGRNCGRRGAGLYADGKLFACRHCCGLAYASRQQGPRNRGMDQARGITMPLARAPLRSR